VRNLTVITNGPDTFLALQERPGVTALLTGGPLDPRTGSLVGPIATRSARSLLLRRLFVSAAALDPNVAGREVGDGASPVSLSDYINTQFDPGLSWTTSSGSGRPGTARSW
jgi:hypothetical protein